MISLRELVRRLPRSSAAIQSSLWLRRYVCDPGVLSARRIPPTRATTARAASRVRYPMRNMSARRQSLRCDTHPLGCLRMVLRSVYLYRYI